MRARFVRNGHRACARLALLSGTALVGAAFSVALAPTPAFACSPEPCTWSGAGGNGLWSNPGNWSAGGPPGTGDSFVLTNSGSAPSTNDNNVAGTGYNSVTLNPNAAGYTVDITAASGLRLQSGGSFTDNNTLHADTFTGAGGIALSGPVTVTTAAGASLTFQTVVSDNGASGSLIKAGAGTLTLTGTNTYSGGTHINGGTLAVDTDFALGASGTRITFDGGTLAFIGGPTGGINRPITLNSGGGTIDTSLGNPTTFVGNIDGSGSLTKIGTGTLELFGNNTYSGATNINAGTLSVGFDTGLPSTTAVTVNSGATLSIADNVRATIGSLAGGGSVVIGPSAPGTTLAVGDSGASTTFSGAITGAGSLLWTVAAH
jgi:autotransporter-associated beta strand protein